MPLLNNGIGPTNTFVGCLNFERTPSLINVLPRDAVHTLSKDVCLSVARRYCVKTAKHVRLYSPSGSHTILVFHPNRYGSTDTLARTP